MLKFICSLKKRNTLLYILIFLNILYAAVTVFVPEIFKLGVDAITNMSLIILKKTIILGIVSTILNLSLSAANNLLFIKLSNEYEKSLQAKLLNKILSVSPLRKQKITSGVFLTKAISNTSAAVTGSIEFLQSSICGFAMIIFSVVYMSFLNLKLMLCMLIFNILRQFVSFFVEKKLRRNSDECVAANTESNSFLMNILHNMLTVRIYDAENFFNSKWERKQKTFFGKAMKMFIWSNGFQDGTWATVKLAEFVVLYGIGGYFVYKNTATVSALLAFTFAIDILAKGIEKLTYSAERKSSAVSGIDAVSEILTITDETKPSRKALNETAFDIHVKNLCFKYDSKTIFGNISFNINYGDHVLITGENGSGKSTLLNLLCGLIRPDGGKISYGDYLINNASLPDICSSYSYISQTSDIFDCNIYENIALSKKYDKKRADAILNALNLKHAVNTAAKALSQGEKQRIGIARAIYNCENTSVLFGDEIFSNIDKDNAVKIIEYMKEIFKNKTVIIVSHTALDFNFNKILHVTEYGVSIKEVCGIE